MENFQTDGNIPLTGLNNKISTITGDIQTLNNEVDYLSETLVGFDNTATGNVSAYINTIKTDLSNTTNFLSGVLSGFDDSASGNVSAYISGIADIVDDLNTNSIKSQIVQLSTTINDSLLTCTSGISLVIANSSENKNLTITKPEEEETTGPNQSLLKKMFNTTDDVYKIVVKFHGEINILKLLAKSDTNTFVEFYPDFQEVYDPDGSRSHTQITVFLPEEAMEFKEVYFITWRVTYSR